VRIRYNILMKTYVLGFLAVFLLFLGNSAGIHFGWYESYWFYDIPMHILGGFSIGLSLVAFVGMHGKEWQNKRQIILIGVLVASILWELFEAYYNIAGAPVGSKAYWIDTVKDLVDDLFGGVVVIYFAKLFK
jgi:hypothetical protein